jgi:gliding motility-associated transport system ATP-binding protein
MIEVNQLTKRYGDITAIQDVTFRVEKGEILGFLGPNGAGKTTTMRILSGFIPATSGTAVVAGYDVFENPMEVKRRIGYLPEHPPLYFELTVTEYLKFVGRIKGIPRPKLPASLDRVVEQTGLKDVRGRLVGNLSRGFRQRVGLAQAMIHEPEVLILDEPTVGLDPKQIIEVRQLIKQQAGERTVILSSHILPEVTATCRRIVIIHEGKVVAVDTQERLSAQLRRSDKVGLKVRQATPDLLNKLQAIPGVLHVFQEPESFDGHRYLVESQLDHDVREELARCVVSQGCGLLEMKGLAMTLEEVFLRLTTEEQSFPATDKGAA